MTEETAYMKLRVAGMALMALVALAVLAGCSRASAPSPAEKAPKATPAPKPPAAEVPLEKPARDDAALLKQVLNEGAGFSPASGKMVPTFETTTLPHLVAARRAFAGTLAPHDTLGRRLVAIVYRRALLANTQPRETLSLVYEGRLLVTEGTAYRIRYPIVPNATRETTALAGGVQGTVEVLAGQTTATWDALGFRYRVSSPDLSKAEVVLIARSMAP